MSPLTIALIGVGGLVLLNLVHGRRRARAADLPPAARERGAHAHAHARGRRDVRGRDHRRAAASADDLRATAAARDAARDRARALRLGASTGSSRSSPSAASSPRPSARCARAWCCTACAARRSSASSAASTACPRCARAWAIATRSCASRARTRSRAWERKACSTRSWPRSSEGETVFSQGATGRGAARLRPGLGHRAAHAARRSAPPAPAAPDRRRARRAARVRRRARARRRAATIPTTSCAPAPATRSARSATRRAPSRSQPWRSTAARPWFVRTAAAGACGQIGDPRTADTLVDVLDSEEWYPRNAAAAALVRLGDAGLAAVCSRVARSSRSPSRTTGACSTPPARPRTRSSARPPASAGCAASSPPPHAPGATARLEELAARETPIGPLRGRACSGPRRATRSALASRAPVASWKRWRHDARDRAVGQPRRARATSC